jgi:hypothetical protein
MSSTFAWLCGVPVVGPLARRQMTHMGVRALRQPAEDLRAAVPLLPQAAKEMERQYLRVGASLERLAEVVEELSDGAENVVAMALGKEGGDSSLESSLRTTEVPLAFLDQALTDMPEISVEITRARALVRSTTALEQRLASTLAPLQYIQRLFAIEAAPLQPEHREYFTLLADATGTLFDRTRASMAENFGALRETERSLSDSIGTVDTLCGDRAQLIGARRAKLAETLRAMNQEIQQSSQRNVQLTNATGDLAGCVTNAITAMQTQDTVAQQLAHATTGLKDAMAAVDALTADPQAALLQRIPSLARIELGQLDAAKIKVAESACQLQEAVAGVMTRLRDLDEGCLLLTEFTHITASVDGMAQVLLDGLTEMRDLTRATVDVVQKIERTLRPADQVVGALNNAVYELAIDMQRLALNSQIRAVQLDKGTGLEALASQAADIARETLGVSAELGQGLSELHGGLSAIMARVETLRQAGEQSAGICESEGAAEQAKVHQVRDSVLNAVLGLGVIFDRARKIGGEMQAGIETQEVTTKIDRVHAAVEHLIEV